MNREIYTKESNMETLHLAGDSTLCFYDKDRWPRAGWGMMIGFHLRQGIEVRNLALSGRSSKSFKDEGQWELLMAGVKSGDGVMIQFGHNDEKIADPSRYTSPEDSFPDNLRSMVRDVQTAGAQPFLLSPVERRNFEGGRIVPSHGPYQGAVAAVARELSVPYLDLCQASTELYEELGPGASTRLFMHVGPGIYPGFPAGEIDNTHFNLGGAAMIAGLVGQLLLQHPEARSFLPL